MRRLSLRPSSITMAGRLASPTMGLRLLVPILMSLLFQRLHCFVVVIHYVHIANTRRSSGSSGFGSSCCSPCRRAVVGRTRHFPSAQLLDTRKSSSSSENEINDTADVNDDSKKDTRRTGDRLRAATGIRPSLYPITINAIASVLRSRARKLPDLPLRTSDSVQPVDVALAAGKIAAEAIAQRQATSEEDEGSMKLLPDEERTVAGRIVGVTMRLDDLEVALHDRCIGAKWVAKYGEWGSFGVLEDEVDANAVSDRILQDPLFAMNRAECLLALFLHEVEAPQLKQKNETVPDGSAVDFLDSDRRQVLLHEEQ